MSPTSSDRADGRRVGGSLAERRARAGSTDDYQQRRALLVHHAALLFHTRGRSETSLSDIAGAAGMDRANIYYYFANKDELLAEVLRVAIEKTSPAIQRVGRSRLGPQEKVRRLIVTMMQLFDDHYPYLHVYAGQDIETLRDLSIPEEVKAWLVQESERSIRPWRKVIDDGLRQRLFRTDLPAGVVTSTILGAVAWSHRWYRPGGPMSAGAVGEALAGLLVDGLRPRPSHTMELTEEPTL